MGDTQRQTQIIDTIEAGRRIFVVTAPPGCGKSRFALELARLIGRTQRSWDARFVRHDEPAFREELAELSKLKHVVLIVDDADECPALVQQLASATATAGSESTLSLVCLTRTSGRALLTEALASHFPSGAPLELDLGRPSAKLLRELVEKLIPGLSPHHRDAIRRCVADSFFATTLLCSSVARQKMLPQTLSVKNLREYAVRQPIAQAVGNVCSADKAFRALAVYAACAPVRSEDPEIRASAAAHSELTIAEIAALEQRTAEAGLFSVDGRGWLRPVPSLIADVILEDVCLNEQGRPGPFGQALIRGLFDAHHEAIIRNCADIGRLFCTSTRMDFLSELVLERAGALPAQARPEAVRLLQGCSSLAVRQPGTIVRLIEVLAIKGILRAEPAAGELDADALEVNAWVLLAMAGEHDPAIVPHAMEYARRLLVCARSDAANHTSLRDALASSCQFAVARSVAHATAVLDVLNTWAQSSDASKAELAASLVHGFLQLEMHAHRWDQEARTSVWVGLSPSDEICKLRARALDILVRCSRHTAPAVQYAAAASLEHWARGYRNLTDEVRERWASQLERELDTLADSFGKLGATTSHLAVRAAVEHQGWRWWMEDVAVFMQRGGKQILGALPDAKAYSLWKALHEDALPVFPVALEEAVEPEQRRAHLLGLIKPSAARVTELAKELLEQLDPLYSGAPAWSGLFTSVLTALPERDLQDNAPLYLAEFVRRHPAEAWSFVNEESANGRLKVILPTLLVELRAHERARWQEAIQRSLPGTRLFEMQLGALCEAGELDTAERDLVSRGLELDDLAAVHLAARALLGASGPALAAGLSAVFAVLPTRPGDERLWELALDAFARWGDHVLSAPEGEDADPKVRALSGDLLRLLRTYGTSLSWQEGAHTRPLATVIAIFAVAIPHTLKSWMRELWASAGADTDGELPLSVARFLQVVRLIRQSLIRSFWQKQFAEWMTEEPQLAAVGAQGLAELCDPSDPCISSLAARIAQQPTHVALQALNEFVLIRARKESTSAAASELQIIDGWAQTPDLAPELLEALERARQALQSSVEEGLLHGEEPVPI